MMTRDEAYAVMMGFAARLKVKASMRRHGRDDWRVTVEPAGEPAQTIDDLGLARGIYKRVKSQMVLPL